MTAPKHLAIKDYWKHQHYHTRGGPWIKLYAAVLDDATFIQMPEAAQAQLMKLWVLASQFGHPLPNDPKLLAGKIGTTGRFHLDAMIAAKFIVPCETDEEVAHVSGEQHASSALAQSRKRASKSAKTSLAKPLHHERARARSRGELELEKRKDQLQDQELPPADADGHPPAAVPVPWTARLASVWSNAVGEVSPGRVGSTLKRAVDRHGVERVERAMCAYAAVQKSDGKTPNLKWFADQSQVWIDRTTQPVGVIDGEMSDTLELLTRPSSNGVRHG